MPIWPPMPGMSIGMEGASGDLDLDLDIVHLAGLDPLAEGEAGRLARFLAGQRVEQAGHGGLLRGFAHGFAAALAFQSHRFLDQIADDLLDVAADIADLGELGRLDLDERRVGQLGEAPADLGLAAARGADHQDVLGRHLVAQLGAELLPAPAIAQRDSDGALGVLLADDVRIERSDDGFGGEGVVHFLQFFRSCRAKSRHARADLSVSRSSFARRRTVDCAQLVESSVSMVTFSLV